MATTKFDLLPLSAMERMSKEMAERLMGRQENEMRKLLLEAASPPAVYDPGKVGSDPLVPRPGSWTLQGTTSSRQEPPKPFDVESRVRRRPRAAAPKGDDFVLQTRLTAALHGQPINCDAVRAKLFDTIKQKIHNAELKEDDELEIVARLRDVGWIVRVITNADYSVFRLDCRNMADIPFMEEPFEEVPYGKAGT